MREVSEREVSEREVSERELEVVSKREGKRYFFSFSLEYNFVSAEVTYLFSVPNCLQCLQSTTPIKRL